MTETVQITDNGVKSRKLKLKKIGWNAASQKRM